MRPRAPGLLAGAGDAGAAGLNPDEVLAECVNLLLNGGSSARAKRSGGYYGADADAAAEVGQPGP